MYWSDPETRGRSNTDSPRYPDGGDWYLVDTLRGMSIDSHQVISGKRIQGSCGGDVSPEVDIDRLWASRFEWDPVLTR